MPTPLGDILHNIADHTDTILHVLNEPALPADVVQRMNAHILLEEKENSAKLEELHRANPTPLTQKLLDHSFFIQKMLQGQYMSIELKKELLDHFAEEHLEWRMQLGDATAPATPPQPESGYSPSRQQSSHGSHSGTSHSHSGSSHSHSHSSSQKPPSDTASDGKSQWTVGPLWPRGG